MQIALQVSRACLCLQARMAVELCHPRIPIAQALPESFGLGDDNRDVRQLDLAAALVGLRGHKLADAGQHLFLHGEYLGVDLPPIKGMLERCVFRGASPSMACVQSPPRTAASTSGRAFLGRTLSMRQ